MSQEFLVGSGAFDLPLSLGLETARLAETARGGNRFRQARGVTRKCIEKAAMHRRVEQALTFELSFDLDQGGTQPAQQTNAGRLVIHECTAAPVGCQRAAQDQRPAIVGNSLLGSDQPSLVSLG